MSVWKVRCRVSGGVTGTREGYLKRQDKVIIFPNEMAAREEARNQTAAMNNKHSKAYFEYWAVKEDE